MEVRGLRSLELEEPGAIVGARSERTGAEEGQEPLKGGHCGQPVGHAEKRWEDGEQQEQDEPVRKGDRSQSGVAEAVPAGACQTQFRPGNLGEHSGNTDEEKARGSQQAEHGMASMEECLGESAARFRAGAG